MGRVGAARSEPDVRAKLNLPRDARSSRLAERLTEQVAVIGKPVGVIRQIEGFNSELECGAGQPK
jgi:hypothetical protein